jgi:hypothetical protein
MINVGREFLRRMAISVEELHISCPLHPDSQTLETAPDLLPFAFLCPDNLPKLEAGDEAPIGGECNSILLPSHWNLGER